TAAGDEQSFSDAVVLHVAHGVRGRVAHALPPLARLLRERAVAPRRDLHVRRCIAVSSLRRATRNRGRAGGRAGFLETPLPPVCDASRTGRACRSPRLVAQLHPFAWSFTPLCVSAAASH